MIQNKLIHKLLLVLVTISMAACTSVDTQDEESMMNMDSEVSADAETDSEGTEPGSEDLNEDFADEGGEVASTETPSEDLGDTAAAGEDEFSEEEFDTGDDLVQESPPSEPPVEETPPPPPVAADETFEESTPIPEPVEEIPPPIVSEPVMTPPSVEATAQITNIRYKASPTGGMLVIEGDSPLNYQTRLNSDTNQFIIEVPGAALPEKLKRPYLLKEFPTARFGAVNAYQKPGSSTARIVIQLKAAGEGEPQVEADGNNLKIVASGTSMLADSEAPRTSLGPQEIELAIPGEETKAVDFSSPDRDERILGARSLDEFLMGNTKFYGSPLSIQIKDADIRDVLNFIADESGSNIVVSEEVTGKVTIKLRQVPWDQALVTVMRANKLGYVRQGSVIRISKLDALRDEATQARDILKAQKEVRPLRVKVIPVSFAKVEDMVVQFKEFITKERGSMVADVRTSSLIITDEEEVLERISRLVKELDVEPMQVMIEGKVVEAGESFTQSAGVNWGLTGQSINLGSGSAGAINMNPNLNIRTVAPEQVTQRNLAFGLNIGTMDILGDLNATLALAESDSLLKVISSPRVVAMNKEKAEIRQETEQVTIVTVVDQSGNITRGVQRTPIVVRLTVTPQITNDANVILDVDVEREFAGPLLDQFTQARAVNNRTAKTKILVKNGQTAVIGGIYQSDSTETNTGVPFLKDIPVLGWLFKDRAKDFVKNELLIFLTPRILNTTTQNAKI